MKHISAIENALKKNEPSDLIARKIFLSYPTAVFAEKEEWEFSILNSVKVFFDVPFSSIKIVGSAKTTNSLHKENVFTPQVSDLDVAIIDSSLFLKYVEISYRATNGYSDLTKFKRNSGGQASYNNFYKYIVKGVFRPDLMPECAEKTAWWAFFNRLSGANKSTFKSINAGIYMSEYIFEQKHSQLIDNYKMMKGI